jgi:hypothetical protein
MAGLTSLVVLSGTTNISAKQANDFSALQTSVTVAQRIQLAEATKMTTTTVLKTGMLVKAEKPTQGTVRIVNDNGKRFLELGQNFKTSEMGPDLHVILHRTDAPPVAGIKKQDYVILGRLQKFTGAQRYEIPKDVNLDGFKSAAIWCRQFNATFGYAKLGK